MGRDYNKLILDKLEDYTEVYFKTLNQCNLSFSEKHIHDYRVSIRRMVSLLKFINSLVPNVYSTNLLKHLKSKMKLLSPIRDVQVQLLRISAFENKYHDLQDFYFYLIRREKDLIQQTQYKIIESGNVLVEGNLIWLKVKLKEIFRELTISDDDFLIQYSILKERLANSIKEMSKDSDESIHNLRLSFKKYRYYLEIICRIFPDNKEEIKRLRKLQNTMGAIQDIYVISNSMNNYIRDTAYEINKDYMNFSYDLTADKQYLKTKLYLQIESYQYPSIEKTVRRVVFP